MKKLFCLIPASLLLCCNNNGENKHLLEKDTPTLKTTTASKARQTASPEIPIENIDGLTDTLNIPIGKVNDIELVYDCKRCRVKSSDSISIYYDMNGVKKPLLDLPIGDYYVEEVSCFKQNGHDFIYVGTTHTYGHTQGHLYYLNTVEMKAYEVETMQDKRIKSKQTINPDTLQLSKTFHLTMNEKNEFGGGVVYKSKKSGLIYNHNWQYSIKKIIGNRFIADNGDDDVWEIVD